MAAVGPDGTHAVTAALYVLFVAHVVVVQLGAVADDAVHVATGTLLVLFVPQVVVTK